jgi:hypothetical protein
MAQVTVELGRLLTTDFKLFDFDYQFDDANFKERIEQEILDYYYDSEIGYETPDMFKRRFKARWTRIMPYYNELYNTTLLAYNPLTNYKVEDALEQLATSTNTQTTDMTLTGTNTVKNTGTNSIEGTIHDSTSVDDNTKSSDYPQQPIAGGDFLSGESTGSTNSTADSTNNATTTLDTTIATTDSGTNAGTITNTGSVDTGYTKTIEGITGITYPELIEKHRGAILRINDMIIQEMKKCFILLY